MTADSHAIEENWLAAVILAIGRRLAPRRIAGRLILTLPGGRRLELGDDRCAAPAELHLRNWRPLWRSIRRASVGFCEGYIAGEWESPAPERVFSFYLENRQSLDRSGRFVFFSSLAVRAWHGLRANTRRGSKKNIEAHYDLGNDFYRLWLDETMSYSSAYFGNGAEQLEDAQMAKNRLIADALDLAAGQRLLEVGCGWGSFVKLAAERGARVTGITLSKQQLNFAQKKLDGQVRVLLQDYREVQGDFDRIASIEMIEAVGEANWCTYFGMLHDRLLPGGVAVIQAITIDERWFPIYRSCPDFIQRHIFPGGMLPTKTIMREQAEAVGMTFEVTQRFGADYARTLHIWRERFNAAEAQLEQMGFDRAFRRKWRLYLSYCEAAFSHGAIDVGIYRLRKAASRDLQLP